jgi:hypothetical protein
MAHRGGDQDMNQGGYLSVEEYNPGDDVFFCFKTFIEYILIWLTTNNVLPT